MIDHITLVYAYYENGGMLDRQIKEWKKYKAKDRFKAIIVDDGSQNDPAESHLRGVDVGFDIELYRIDVDIPWNQDGARNLAMTHADGWCLITDMDHMLSVAEAKKLVKKTVDPNIHYTLQRIKPDGSDYHHHPNSYVLHREFYWKAGGYDESYRGYYGSDGVFKRQLQNVGDKKLLKVALTMFGRSDISDASTRNYGRKDTEYHIAQNPDLLARRESNAPPIEPLNFDWHRVL